MVVRRSEVKRLMSQLGHERQNSLCDRRSHWRGDVEPDSQAV